MHFFKHFYFKTIKYDLLNKHTYKKINQIPNIKKIILNFGCKTPDLKFLMSSLLALEIISHQRGKITKTKSSNILLKIKKGNPIGCKVTLQKNLMLYFLTKLLTKIFPRLKDFNGFRLKKNIKENIFSFKINETLHFSELERQYYLFNNLTTLNITIITNCNLTRELIFLLKSYAFPLKDPNCIYNSNGRV